ncbi:KR domain-containing protein [Hypoxylon crocopeplum]|nr:KR domain-containing protein [Hypoxylon crocopeplum]
MVDLLRRRQTLAHEIFQKAMKRAFAERLKPPQPIHTFPAGNVVEAFRHFQDADVPGKRIIELNPDNTVLANIKTKPRYSFSSGGTYVIAGGLGGIGRSVARWMVSRGARYLILLSRSGAKSQAAKVLVSELESQNVCVTTPAVDISDLAALEDTLKTLARSMPPTRGCIQAAVSSRNYLFPNMTHEDWTVETNPKVTGSWNLHTILPSGLDFFVFLASLSGIVGGSGQTNYAAGNAFQDALARHRILLGEKAVSIDLGLVVSEGVAAENADIFASVYRLGRYMKINHDELVALLDYYCDPALPLLSCSQAQILFGLETSAAMRANGINFHHSVHRPLFRQLFRMGLSSSSTSGQAVAVDYPLALKQAASDEEAGALVTDWFRTKIAQILGLQEEDVDVERPITSYGVDSGGDRLEELVCKRDWSSGAGFPDVGE